MLAGAAASPDLIVTNGRVVDDHPKKIDETAPWGMSYRNLLTEQVRRSVERCGWVAMISEEDEPATREPPFGERLGLAKESPACRGAFSGWRG